MVTTNINEILKNSLNDITEKLEKAESSLKYVQDNNYNKRIIQLKTELDLKNGQIKNLQEEAQDEISEGILKYEEIIMSKKNFEEEKKKIINVLNFLNIYYNSLIVEFRR